MVSHGCYLDGVAKGNFIKCGKEFRAPPSKPMRHSKYQPDFIAEEKKPKAFLNALNACTRSEVSNDSARTAWP